MHLLAKCPLAKCPLTKCPLAKCPLAKCPLTKCPLAKCPLAKWALPKCLDTGFNNVDLNQPVSYRKLALVLHLGGTNV